MNSWNGIGTANYSIWPPTKNRRVKIVNQRLVRFSKPEEARSKFVNDVLAKNLGKATAMSSVKI